MNDMVEILKHDLHKIKTTSYTSHKKSLKNELMKKADGIAARFSRNCWKFEIEDVSPYRQTYWTAKLFPVDRIKNISIRQELSQLFTETDSLKLHSLILESKTLNLYSEAQNYPFTSLKYHLLLTCAIYYNLQKECEWFDLYLCENPSKVSQFQVIYQD